MQSCSLRKLCVNNSRPTFGLWRITGHTVENVDQNQEDRDK